MIGLEPITCWLQISCSANWATSAYDLWLLTQRIAVLKMTPTGFEPVLPPWKGDVLTAWPWSHICLLHKNILHKITPRVGLEPTTTRLTAECSTIELSRIIKVCTFKTSYKSDLFFCNPHRKTHLDSASLHLDGFASQICVQLNPDLCRHVCKIRISLYLFFSVINQIKPSTY